LLLLLLLLLLSGKLLLLLLLKELEELLLLGELDESLLADWLLLDELYGPGGSSQQTYKSSKPKSTHCNLPFSTHKANFGIRK
jgi:hypothetical protein